MRPDTLARLHSLRQAARDRAGRELAIARAAKIRVQSQLDTLTRYDASYAGQRAAAVREGTSVALLRNHFGFANQLSAAIAAAGERVVDAGAAVAAKAEAWRVEEHAVLAYETLSKRQATAAQRAADRAEQRRADARTTTTAARARVHTDAAGDAP